MGRCTKIRMRGSFFELKINLYFNINVFGNRLFNPSLYITLMQCYPINKTYFSHFLHNNPAKQLHYLYYNSIICLLMKNT